MQAMATAARKAGLIVVKPAGTGNRHYTVVALQRWSFFA